MTHYLREEYGAVPHKMMIEKKEIRVWKVHSDQLNKLNKQSKGMAEVVRKTMDENYEKSRNLF